MAGVTFEFTTDIDLVVAQIQAGFSTILESQAAFASQSGDDLGAARIGAALEAMDSAAASAGAQLRVLREEILSNTFAGKNLAASLNTTFKEFDTTLGRIAGSHGIDLEVSLELRKQSLSQLTAEANANLRQLRVAPIEVEFDRSKIGAGQVESSRRNFTTGRTQGLASPIDDATISARILSSERDIAAATNVTAAASEGTAEATKAGERSARSAAGNLAQVDSNTEAAARASGKLVEAVKDQARAAEEGAKAAREQTKDLKTTFQEPVFTQQPATPPLRHINDVNAAGGGSGTPPPGAPPAGGADDPDEAQRGSGLRKEIEKLYEQGESYELSRLQALDRVLRDVPRGEEYLQRLVDINAAAERVKKRFEDIDRDVAQIHPDQIIADYARNAIGESSVGDNGELISTNRPNPGGGGFAPNVTPDGTFVTDARYLKTEGEGFDQAVTGVVDTLIRTKAGFDKLDRNSELAIRAQEHLGAAMDKDTNATLDSARLYERAHEAALELNHQLDTSTRIRSNIPEGQQYNAGLFPVSGPGKYIAKTDVESGEPQFLQDLGKGLIRTVAAGTDEARAVATRYYQDLAKEANPRNLQQRAVVAQEQVAKAQKDAYARLTDGRQPGERFAPGVVASEVPGHRDEVTDTRGDLLAHYKILGDDVAEQITKTEETTLALNAYAQTVGKSAEQVVQEQIRATEKLIAAGDKLRQAYEASALKQQEAVRSKAFDQLPQKIAFDELTAGRVEGEQFPDGVRTLGRSQNEIVDTRAGQGNERFFERTGADTALEKSGEALVEAQVRFAAVLKKEADAEEARAAKLLDAEANRIAAETKAAASLNAQRTQALVTQSLSEGARPGARFAPGVAEASPSLAVDQRDPTITRYYKIAADGLATEITTRDELIKAQRTYGEYLRKAENAKIQSDDSALRQANASNLRRGAADGQVFAENVENLGGGYVADLRGKVAQFYKRAGEGFEHLGSESYDAAIASGRLIAQQAKANEEELARQNAARLTDLRTNDKGRLVQPNGLVDGAIRYSATGVTTLEDGVRQFYKKIGDGLKKLEADSQEYNDELVKFQKSASGKGGVLQGFKSGFLSGGFGGASGDGAPLLEGLATAAGTTVKYTALYGTLNLLQTALSQVGSQMVNFADSNTDLQIALDNTTGATQKATDVDYDFLDSLEQISITAGSNVGDVEDVVAAGIRTIGLNASYSREEVKKLGNDFGVEAQKMAVLAKTDITDAAGNLRAIGSAFDIPLEASARINDALVTGKNVGGGDEKDTAQAVSTAGEALKSAGFSLEQSFAIASRIQAATDQSGAAVGNKLSRIVSIVGGSAGQKAIAAVNASLPTADKVDTTADVQTQLQELSKAFAAGDINEAGKKSLINSLGGTSSAKELITILESYNQIAGQVSDTQTKAGASAKEYQARLGDLSQRVRDVQGALSAIVVNLGESGVLDPIVAAFDALATSLKAFATATSAINKFTHEGTDGMGILAVRVLEGAAAFIALSRTINALNRLGVGGVAGKLERLIAPQRSLARRNLNVVDDVAAGAVDEAEAAKIGTAAGTKAGATAAKSGAAAGAVAEIEGEVTAISAEIKGAATTAAATTAETAALASEAVYARLIAALEGAAAVSGYAVSAEATLAAAEVSAAILAVEAAIPELTGTIGLAASEAAAATATAALEAATAAYEQLTAVVAEAEAAGATAAAVTAAKAAAEVKAAIEAAAAEAAVATQAAAVTTSAESAGGSALAGVAEGAAGGAIAKKAGGFTGSFKKLLGFGGEAEAGAAAGAEGASLVGLLGGPVTIAVVGLTALGVVGASIKGKSDRLGKAMDSARDSVQTLNGIDYTQSAADLAEAYKNSAADIASKKDDVKRQSGGTNSLLHKGSTQAELDDLATAQAYAEAQAKKFAQIAKTSADNLGVLSSFGDPAALSADSLATSMKGLTDAGVGSSERLKQLIAYLNLIPGVKGDPTANTNLTVTKNPEVAARVTSNLGVLDKDFAQTNLSKVRVKGGFARGIQQYKEIDNPLNTYFTSSAQKFNDLITASLPKTAAGKNGTYSKAQIEKVASTVAAQAEKDWLTTYNQLKPSDQANPNLKPSKIAQDVYGRVVSQLKGTGNVTAATFGIDGNTVVSVDDAVTALGGLQDALTSSESGDNTAAAKIADGKKTLAEIDKVIAATDKTQDISGLLDLRAETNKHIVEESIAQGEKERAAAQAKATSEKDIKSIGEKFFTGAVSDAFDAGDEDALVALFNEANTDEIAAVDKVVAKKLAQDKAAAEAEAASNAAIEAARNIINGASDAGSQAINHDHGVNGGDVDPQTQDPDVIAEAGKSTSRSAQDKYAQDKKNKKAYDEAKKSSTPDTTGGGSIATGKNETGTQARQAANALKDAALQQQTTTGNDLQAATQAAKDADDQVAAFASKAERSTLEYYQAVRDANDKRFALIQAQEKAAELAGDLKIDLSNEVTVAKKAVTDAQKELDDAEKEADKRGYKKGSKTRAAFIDPYKKNLVSAQTSAETTATQSYLDGLDTQLTLGRITHQKYLQLLTERRDQLLAEYNSMSKNAQGQAARKKLIDDIDKTIKSAADSLNDQFNLGDIKVPTVYQVRESIKAKSAGSVLSNNGALSTAGNVTNDNSTRSVVLNGVPIETILSMLQDLFGKKVRTTAARRINT